MKDLFDRLFGTETPFKSLTFWGVVIMSGVPSAVSQYFGYDLNPILNSLGPILAVIGIRRRL